MNLSKLFETQWVLDERIMKEKGLEGQDLLPMKILALQVELGELANEWRGFKFWSENREPRTKKMHYMRCIVCGGRGEDPLDTMEVCSLCEGDGRLLNKTTNPLLEEYVDCLHFILSIGLEVGLHRFDFESLNPIYKEFDITTQILRVMDYTMGLRDDDYCLELIQSFVYLGEMLGFTWEQIEEAYYAKNQINHERQATGY